MVHPLIFVPAFFIAAAAVVDSPLELRLIVPEGTPGAMRYTLPTINEAKPEVFWCAEDVLLNAASVKFADASFDAFTGWTITIQLTEKGKKQLADVTTRYKGQRIGILSHGKMLEALLLQTPITGGIFEIKGPISYKEAQDLTNAFGQDAAQSSQPTSPLTPPVGR